MSKIRVEFVRSHVYQWEATPDQLLDVLREAGVKDVPATAKDALAFVGGDEDDLLMYLFTRLERVEIPISSAEFVAERQSELSEMEWIDD